MQTTTAQTLTEMQCAPDLLDYPFVSILIPARNEEKTIEAVAVAALTQTYDNYEVIIINDNSTDSTPQIVANLQQIYPNLKTLNSDNLPAGWLGKPHALWLGYQQCNPISEWVLFIDADMLLRPNALHDSINYVYKKGLDLL